jgi:hypothetical protein
MLFIDIFCELLDNNLQLLVEDFDLYMKLTFVLLIGLGLLPRLRLRLSLLYLPFLLGLRLNERGEMVRRGRETDLESGRE